MAINFLNLTDDANGINLATLNTTAGATGLSLLAWIKPNGFAGGDEGVILGKADSTGTAGPWKLQIQDGGSDLRFIVETGTGADSLTDSTAFSTGVWKFVAGIYNGSSMFTFVDAVQTATAGKTGTIISSTEQARIAGLQPSSGSFRRRFNGVIDDVRIYNRGLTVAELETIFYSRGSDGIVHGLLHRWLLDEQASGVTVSGAGSVKDSGSGQFNGTAIPAPVYADSILKTRRK